MKVGPSARRFLDNQTLAIRRKIIDVLVWLDHNPRLTPDDERKRPFDAPPAVLRILQDSGYWVISYLLANGELMVANIGDSSETPHLRRIARS